MQGHELLWSRVSLHLCPPPTPPPPAVPPPLSPWLDRKQSGLCAPGTFLLVPLSPCRGMEGGGVAEKGNASFLVGQTGAEGALRRHFLYGDTEGKTEGALHGPDGRPHWRGRTRRAERSGFKFRLCPEPSPPWLCLGTAGGVRGGGGGRAGVILCTETRKHPPTKCSLLSEFALGLIL